MVPLFWRLFGTHVQPGPWSGRKMAADKLWREFFSDPFQWWDNRSEKVNPRYPDFKHKKTQQSLWVDNSLTPPWVRAELATMAPDAFEADMHTWNVRLRRHVKAGEYWKTIELFEQMQRKGMIPDKFTFIPVLNACSGLQSLEKGRRVHVAIIDKGYECDLYVATCLVDMYAKCGSIEDAWIVFKMMPEHSVVSWSAMIVGYVKSGRGLKAIELFWKMQEKGVEPDAVTFVGALNACASIASLEEGRRVHEQIIQRGQECDPRVANCLLDMYAKCGVIDHARSVFNKMSKPSVVSWNAIIGGYVKSGHGSKAMELFWEMHHEGVEPDAITFVAALSACANIVALEEGRRVHEKLILRGCESDVYVGTCLVDMYAKCGSMEDVWSVFNKMVEHDVVCWNAMITGYVKSGQGLEARAILSKMEQEGVEPDAVTFIGLLNACANIAALEEGRRVHEELNRRGFDSDVYVATCLVDMYAKCGSVDDAWCVFSKMQEHNVVSWTTMIGGYAMHGHAKKAVGLFRSMSKEGMEVNGITFTCLLSACSHGGLVKEGLRYFKSMTSCYDMLPTAEHYAGMVDILGRAGRLEEAEEITKMMPMERDASVWRSLFGACSIHGNFEMAKRVAGKHSGANWTLKMRSGNVLLSNSCAAA